jgi:eukaryotic-like serine/threonine-protein kinase
MNGNDSRGSGFPGAPGSGGLSGGSGSGARHGAAPPLSGQSGVPAGTGSLHQGVVLGKYQIVRQLGSGGMGSVFEAVHTQIGKPVALKTMNPALAADPRAEARFMREAAAASRLGHPNVVDVTDYGSDQGIAYIVMELMHGEDLAAHVAHAPAGLDSSFVADVMLAVCAGVYAAHEKGVVHRDLKPQNIFLSRTAMGDVVPKVLDFGISKLLDDDAAGSLTNSGSVMGTTHYLSPEQVTGMPVDGNSDQFALGVILFECLTGQRPHQGDTIFTIMRAISEGRFPRPRALRPDMVPALEGVILRAMALRPDGRYPTVHALGNGLLPFASPKGRILWGDYFARPPANSPGANVTMAAPFYASGGHPGPTVMMGGHPFAGDTRSGVGPVSVIGSGEVDRPPSRGRFRGIGFTLIGGALAAAAFAFFRPTPRSVPPVAVPAVERAGKTIPAAPPERPSAKQEAAAVAGVTAPATRPTAPAPAATAPASAAPPERPSATATAEPAVVPSTAVTPPARSAPIRPAPKAAFDDDRTSRREKAEAAARAEARARSAARAAAAAELTALRKAAATAPTKSVAAPKPAVIPRPRPTPKPPVAPVLDDSGDLFEGPRPLTLPTKAPILD